MIPARGYLVSACRKNIDHFHGLLMEDPTAVRERVQELVNFDKDRFAATELDDVSGTKESSPEAEYVVAGGLSLMKDERMTGSASIFHMFANYRHDLHAVF